MYRFVSNRRKNRPLDRLLWFLSFPSHCALRSHRRTCDSKRLAETETENRKQLLQWSALYASALANARSTVHRAVDYWSISTKNVNVLSFGLWWERFTLCHTNQRVRTHGRKRRRNVAFGKMLWQSWRENHIISVLQCDLTANEPEFNEASTQKNARSANEKLKWQKRRADFSHFSEYSLWTVDATSYSEDTRPVSCAIPLLLVLSVSKPSTSHCTQSMRMSAHQFFQRQFHPTIHSCTKTTCVRARAHAYDLLLPSMCAEWSFRCTNEKWHVLVCTAYTIRHNRCRRGKTILRAVTYKIWSTWTDYWLRK